MRWLAWAEAGEELADLVVNPVRPGRHEPRALKHVSKAFVRMKKARHAYKPRQRKVYRVK